MTPRWGNRRALGGSKAYPGALLSAEVLIEKQGGSIERLA
jgi:hypothetical protein